MHNNAKILIVDDSKIDQLIIQDILRGYEHVSAYDGDEALAVLNHDPEIDMIILDLNMPRMNGFEVLKALRNKYAHLELSVIILTNYEEIENEIKGLELGAVDYVRKPLNAASLLKRIEVHLNLIRAKKEVRNYSQELEKKVQIRTEQLTQSRDVTVNALISLLEVRDIESSNHTKRTQYMMRTFAEHLVTKPQYSTLLDDHFVEAIYKTAPLHDIGKVGIPDSILLKPGKLTPNEFDLMKEHTQYGVNALTQEYSTYQMDDFLNTAVRLIGGHHEKFDGTGYPNQLKGDAIPIEGRMMAIVDAYDAITSKRIYKEAFSHQYALDEIKNSKTSHFDPDLADAFLEISDDILEIALCYRQGIAL